MRAMVVTELSGPEGIVAQEVPEPAAEGLVLIDVKASGVCFPDLLITYGKYQIRPEPPFIPGAEISGVVVSAPEGSGFAPGDRVSRGRVSGWVCRADCRQPGAGTPNSGRTRLRRGGLADHQLSDDGSSRSLVARSSSRGRQSSCWALQAEVGTATIQLAKAHGARVIAVVRREGVDDFLRELGADEVGRRWLRDGESGFGN